MNARPAELTIMEVDNGYAVWDLGWTDGRMGMRGGNAPRWVFSNPVSLADFLRMYLAKAVEVKAEDPA